MRFSSIKTASLGALLIFTLGACGGSDSDPFSGGTTTLFSSSNRTLFQDSSADPGTDGLRMGDTANDVAMRLGLRFTLIDPLGLTPAADDVESVTLQLRQTRVVGAPYAAFGAAVVDRADFGLTLGSGDFAPTVLATSVGALMSDGTPGVLQVDVTAAVVAALRAGSLTSDLLVRFPTSSVDAAAQYAEFERATGNGDGPILLIRSR
ncbi:MAG: hypothetical protein P1V36_11530 [Planctomycetota bacterium]|nr:hypothetical protein [Planctomycetota bacterium]